MRKKNKKAVRIMAASMSAALVLTSASTGMWNNVFAADKEIMSTAEESVLPYLDVTLSFEERAADLVSRMTLEEKQSQLKARSAAAIPRLGVRQYDWWSEALHGVARSGEATSFPTGLGIATTWDRDLVQEMMDITSDEARAYTKEKGKGLSYWSPTVNLARDPRWGRAEETYGEDPYLTAQIGSSFVKGLQGDDEKYLKAIATVKHFAANNSEYNRHNGSSDMDERTLREYYTKPYKDIVQQANVESVMTSYNRLNGTPMPVNSYMMDTLLRRTWGFDGYITSDCGGIRDISSGHHWVPEGWDHAVNATEATAFAIKAGNDLNCGSVYASQAVNAVNQGLLSEDDIDVALVRLFTARMKTGEFDPQEMVPYASDEYSWANQISAADHTQKAEQSSDEAVVLLKNEPAKEGEGKLLPLDKDSVESVVIVGDLADEVILGDYSGSPKAENKSNPVQGLQKLLGNDKVTYIVGGTTSIYGTYNFNIKNFKLIGEDGKVLRTLAPSENNGLSNCRVEGGGNLGYTKAGGYIYYEGLNMNDVKRISADVACPSEGRGGSIEVHLDKPDGTLLGTIKTSKTGDWQSYQTFETAYSQGGFDGERNIYFVFKDPVISSGLTAEEIETIKKADAVIAYVGTRENDSAEERDRTTLDLPRNQADLVSTLAELNPNTVAYIQAVGEVNVESFKNEVPAMLWCTYNGQAQGNAMARVLFGEANPSGKLPFTWYTSEHDLAHIGNYTIRPDDAQDGRTYQYYQGKKSYPFGHGLSYSEFAYSNLKISKNSVTPNDTFTVSVDVENTSDVTGKEVVELYIASPNADGQVRPVKELKGFDKVELAAGEKKTVSMEVDASELYYWDADKMEQTYDQGTYKVQVGSSSEDIRQEGSFDLSGTLDKTLQTVTAIPDKTSLDAEEPENKAATKLSAAMNDQTFVDLENAEVTYTTSNKNVATVDEDGIVTPVGGGTALITASVTVGGVTKTDSYPVAVAGEEILDIVEQEDTDFTAMNSVDDLAGAGWEIIRPNSSNPVKVENGNGLVLKSERGDLYQTQNTAKNLVAKELKGDWTATVHLTADLIPTQRYQQAGVLIYGDDDNYIKVADIFDGKASAQVQFGQEADGTWTPLNAPFVSSKEYYFKIEKAGMEYTISYSTDGETFHVLGTAAANFAHPKMVLFAFNGEQGSDPMTATFKDVVFEKLGAECTCGLYDLAFMNRTEIAYEDGIKGIELNASAMTRGDCQVEGHPDNAIEYQYAISDAGENTANAVLEGNILKAANAGKVTVEVTATWNEAKETTQAEFTILEKEVEPEPGEVSKKTLGFFLERAKKHVADGDTEDVDDAVKKLFAEAIAEGDAMMAKADATREEVMNATIKLMYAIHALDMKFPSADKTALEMAMEVARQIQLDKYVDAGKAEFTAALENGQTVLDKEDATQEEIDNAWNELVDAMHNLRYKADKKNLEDLLKQVEGLDLSKYTEESVQAFQAALARAQAVMADDTLSTEDKAIVEEAVKALADAKAKLALKDDQSGDTDKDGMDKDNTGKDSTGKDSTDKPDNSKNAPKTGDTTSVVYLLALISAAVVMFFRKKEVR